MRSVVPMLCLLAACSSAEGQGGEAEERLASTPAAHARRVEVATVQPTRARLEMELPAEVMGSRDALLAAALGGYVERIEVADGDTVRRGQVLARVDSASHQARLRQAAVEVGAAKRELERAERLGDAIPAAQRDQAETRHEAALAALRTAQVAAGRTVIRAPFAGVIADVGVEPGEVAPPGAPIVRLVQLDPVHVVATVSDRDVVALEQGMPVRIRTDAQSGAHEGRIVHINPAADLQTRAFRVEIAVPNPERKLLPGMIATVQLAAEREGDQLFVPQDWVVTRREGLGVFVVDDGAARWRPVELGRVVHHQVVIEGGIAPGDRVVVTGQRSLAEGDEVLVTRSGVCCTQGRVVYER